MKKIRIKLYLMSVTLLFCIYLLFYVKKNQFLNSNYNNYSKITHFYSIVANEKNIYFGTNQGLRIFDKEKKDGFEEITVKDGLIENNIEAIAIDDSYILLGTWGGFSLYNTKTHKFKNFTQQTGLISNQIWSVLVDSNYYYIGTNGYGINVYDKNTNTFKIFNKENGIGNDFVYALAKDENYIYAGTDRALLNRYDKKTNKWEIFTPGESFNDSIFCAIAVDKNYIWIGTNKKGVLRFNKETKKWELSKQGFNGYAVYDLCINDYGDVFAGSESGLHKYLNEIDQWIKIESNYFRNLKGENILIESIAFDNNKIWCGTYKHGIIEYDEIEQICRRYYAGISNNYIKTLCCDEDFLYIGFDYSYNGMDCFDSNRKIWQHYLLNNQPVKVIKKDTDYLYIGTWKGLIKFDKKTKVWKILKGLPSMDITSIEVDDNYIWIGTYYGLSVLDKITETIQCLNNDEIISITKNSNFVFVATPSGIDLYDKKTNKWTKFKILKKITVLKTDEYNLWIGTEFGEIHRYNFKNANWQCYKKKIKSIKDIIIHKEVYFATDKGINIYDIQKNKWRKITQKDGLIYNDILCLTENEKYFICGTFGGISKINKINENNLF